MADHGTLIAQLEKEYCPPLDNATLFAILFDFDVAKPDELQAARQILDNIKESAYAEEATGFDPSGSSGRDESGALLNGEENESANSQRGWSSYTDDTSLSQGMSAPDLDGLDFSSTMDGGNENGAHERDVKQKCDAQFKTMDEASSEALLIETFPGVTPFNIKWTLTKYKGDIGLAIDDLLSQVFLEDSGQRPRGIDGFSESELAPRRRKNRQRRKSPKFSQSSVHLENKLSLPVAAKNIWETSSQDVAFISSRAGLTQSKVSAIYHENGASVPATITAIIEEHLQGGLQSEDALVALHTQELSRDFPNVPFPHLLVLVQLTHPSTTSAHELAKALTSRPRGNRNRMPIQLEFRLPPPDISEPASIAKPKSHNAAFPSGTHPPLSSPPASTMDAEVFVGKRNEDFTKAASLFRKGKSDHLMSGAAVFYSDRGRDYDAKAKAISSAAADALVASQSTATTLDLHGVTVKDGIRIARERVTAWWVSKGDGSYTGFTIITGKGTHSEGGRGKLGPEVSKMLIREGWKVEVRSGTLLVTGVLRKRK